MSEYIPTPEEIEHFSNAYNKDAIETCYIIGEEESLVTQSELRELWEGNQVPSRSTEGRIGVSKGFEGSTQNTADLDGGHGLSLGIGGVAEEVEPPYDPVLLRTFLELDSVHFRAVKAKATDSVGRGYKLDSVVPVIPDDFEGESPAGAIKQGAFDSDVKDIKDFIKGANDVLGFNANMAKTAMDYEAIGYSGFEVIRGLDKKVYRINHIPIERIKVLRGWKGFTEVIDDHGHKVYYQNFGEKVVSKTRKDPISGLPAKYDPDEDGPLDGDGVKWNMRDRETFDPTSGVTNAANEIIYKLNPHPKSIYYGLPDFIPSVPAILANVEIRDYLIQFFEHNTIPRYAIIVKGANLDEDVVRDIKKFFSTQVKGRAHSTLLIPIKSIRGEVEVIFQALDTVKKDGEFTQVKQGNDQDIMTAHGTPPAILGIAEAASLGSGKGMSQAQIYRDRIITPAQDSWEECITKLFRLGRGVTTVRMAYNPLDVRDRLQEMQVLTGYKKEACLDINEVREVADLGEPIKGGGRKYQVIPGGTIYVDELEELESSEKTDGQESGTQEAPSSEEGMRAQELRGDGEDGE